MTFNWAEFDNDDPEFTLNACELVRGIVGGFQLPRYQIFRIDNWFGPKWLGFCGKLVGAVGASNFKNVVIPPFVQNRLTAQSLFERDMNGNYSHLGDGPKIHTIGPSAANFKNYARDAAPNTTLFWISGNSIANERGSIMSYKPGTDAYWMFYVEYAKKNGIWVLSQHKQMPSKIADMLKEQSHRYTTESK